MKDEEFETLKKRFFLGVFVAIIFTVPMILFFGRTFSKGDILTKINNKDTFVVLAVNRNCDTCVNVRNTLDINSVDYLVLNRYSNSNYNTIMKKLDIDNEREVFPIIIYVENGKMKANLFVYDNQDNVDEFLNTYELINTQK